VHHEARPLDRNHARDLLKHYWCQGLVVPADKLEQIDAVSLPGETALAAVSRIAEIRTDDIQPFDHIHLRRRISDTELKEQIKEATQYK
jgi:hypothetical protein